jgi:hypothetical protein
VPLPHNFRKEVNMPEPITYQQRYEDLIAKRIIYNEDGSIEVYGTKIDGTTAWIWIHKGENFTVIDHREQPRIPDAVEYEIHHIPHAHTGQPVPVRVPKPRS